MKTTEYISCKILKYQNPSSGIQRRDAIKDYTPQVPFNKMKWINTPIQQPVLSQDNRSKWQHEQASKQADKGYNEYMEAKKTEQGLDRLNQFATFTDYAGLATGIGGLLGKGVKSGIKYGLRKSLKRAANNTLKSPELPYNWAENWMDKQGLPSYAQPNWQGDALALTKDRMKNGGFDRLSTLTDNKYYNKFPQENYNNYEEGMREFLLKAEPRKGKSSDFNVKPSNGAVADQYNKFYTEVFEDAPKAFKSPRANNHLTAHEYSHLVYQPDWKNKVGLSVYNPPYNKEYLLSPKSGGLAEQTARGTQLKNYFGLKEGQEITPEMWNYAKKYYTKDMGFDNNMTEWFRGVKNIPEYLKWLNKNSPAIAIPVIGNKTINDNDKTE